MMNNNEPTRMTESRESYDALRCRFMLCRGECQCTISVPQIYLSSK